MKKIYLLLLIILSVTLTASAQRFMDQLDRGLMAVKMKSGGVFLSWRQLGEEYYGVTYNVYRDGSKIASNLTISNYTDTGGTAENKYTVRAVVYGTEQADSKEARANLWSISSNNSNAAYLDLNLEPVLDRNGNDVTHHYWPNDAIFADLDGDGELEFIIKRINNWETNYENCRGAGADLYPTSNTTEFCVFEAYDVDWQTGTTSRMWWIDCGPNVVSINSTELNILAFDWDMDGKAEVLLRGGDDMILHHSDGTTETIGEAGRSYRSDFDSHSNQQYAWTRSGPEYLVYMNGETGKAYEIGDGKNWMDYPLKRLEDGEDKGNLTSSLTAAWAPSKGYGHVSSKYFMGAPYLDGRTPSIFLARGIYTRHKFMALNVNPSTHKLTKRWEWHSTATGTTPGSNWFGNGFHNYVIADVDEDGRDEIVYGHIVIDDNGQGLHATNYGHGDAMHINDFDPYRKGLEIFTCIEDEPTWGAAYRSGLTGEVYWKFDATGDDGRCLAGNFVNTYPGSIGQSSASPLISLVTQGTKSNADVPTEDQNLLSAYIGNKVDKKLNYRIYWDGDLLSEVGEGTGANEAGRQFTIFESVAGDNGNRIFTSDPDAITNNGSKNNPCLTGDIFGDWREEIVMRLNTGTTPEGGYNFTRGDKLRIYSTIAPTTYAIPTLWHDKQYRQAMGTQMQVYNLPPHTSYFLGELEEITVAPPPVTNRNRTEIGNGGSITSATDNAHVLLAETGNMTVSVAAGANPRVLTDNAPSWTQGHNPSESGPTAMIAPTTTFATHTLTGKAFTGNTQVSKQGGGTLVLPAETQTYTGETKVWEGTLQFNGTMQNSPVWVNRHAALSSTSGTFQSGVTMEYGAQLQPGGAENGAIGNITVSTLTLNFGAQVVFDLSSTDNDRITVTDKLVVEKKSTEPWLTYGPEHKAPVFVFRSAEALATGDYPIGTVEDFGTDDAATALAKIETDLTALDCESAELRYNEETKELYIHIEEQTLTNYGGELSIALSGMNEYHVPGDVYPSATAETFYLPTVSTTATSFTDGGGNTVTPWLSGTFTSAIDGSVTDLGNTKSRTLFEEDYQDGIPANEWTYIKNNTNITNTYPTDQTTYCQLENTDGVNGNRYAFKAIDGVDADNYIIEFDALMTPGNHTSGQSQLILATSNIISSMSGEYIYDCYRSGSYGDYVFSMWAPDNTTTFYVCGNKDSHHATAKPAADTWYHYYIKVEDGNMAFKITKCANNSLLFQKGIDSGDPWRIQSSSKQVKYIGFVLSRKSTTGGKAKIDNIRITNIPEDFSSYAFTEPGTLELTAHADGYKTLTKTFEALYPYSLIYDKKFNQLTATDIPSQLGSNWNTTAELDRWANWSKTNALYRGDKNYKMYKVINESNGIYLGDEQLVYADRNGSYYTALVEGFGVGRNSGSTGSTFHVQHVGSQSTYIYYKVDKSQGGTESFEEHLVPANSDGTYQFSLTANYTLAEMQIYLPVSINDELATTLPQALTNGNAKLYRSALTGGTSWASMVLPFDMTAEQVRATFGDDVTIANLETGRGSQAEIYFETASGTIHANEPFLIKGVTRSVPFLLMGVTGTPEASPIVNNGFFSYIGTYTDQGKIPFHTTDYFFTASVDGLSRVATDGINMRLKGYRGYFHTLDDSFAKIAVLFDNTDEPLATDIQVPFVAPPAPADIYNLSGQLVRRRATTMQGLPKGIYISNGKRIIVK